MSIETIDCSALGCDAELLPVQFDPCNTNYAYMEIGTIFIANVGNPLTDWTDPAEWASRISDSATDADAVREIPLIGTLDIASGDQIVVPGGFAYGKETFDFAGKIYDNNDTNYTWLRSTGCNKKYLFWFKSNDGLHLYGGNSGIETILKGSEPFTDARDDFRTLNVVASWQALLPPLRIPAPF